MKNSLVYAKQDTSQSLSGLQIISEKLRGMVGLIKVRFPKELGEEHPFNYKAVTDLTKKYGLISAIVDKHVDYMMSGGITAKCEDDKAKKIIEEFMRDMQFEVTVRAWLRQAFQKGFSPLEISSGKNGGIDGLKLLKADSVYVDRDDRGVVKGFNQYTRSLREIGVFSKDDVIPFEPDEIADLNFNVYEDNYYGMGIVYPLLCLVDDLICSRKEMHTLMKRKANSPLFFIMGDRTKGPKGDFPTRGEMEELGQKLEWLHNRHEWVLTDYVKPMAIDFGNIGEKFHYIIDNDLETLFMGAQIPSVVMGKANIPEGLAKVQGAGFDLRIQSYREEAEKVIEQKIFKVVLNANGLDQHVEVVWGLPSRDEINESIKSIGELLKNPFLNENLKAQLELKLAGHMELDIKLLEDSQEEDAERKKEEEQEQPVVPEQKITPPRINPPPIQKPIPKAREHLHENFTQQELERFDSMNVMEWVGFNYKSYEQEVLDAVMKDKFEDLRATTKTELDAGFLSSTKIEKLRDTMYEGFEDNLTIREIEQKLKKRIDFKNRYKIQDGKIVLRKDSDEWSLSLPASKRAIMIARTETVRLSNLGALNHYKENDIKQVRWIAALSNRTCPECADLNGMIFKIDNVLVQPPLHAMCRCTMSPVI